MNELQIFNFENNEVRTMIVNDEPFFVANDVAKLLVMQTRAMQLTNIAKKVSWHGVAIR